MVAVAAPWKRTEVAELVELLKAPVVGLVDIGGIPARQMNEMRRKLRKHNVQLRMSRSTLMKLALAELDRARPGLEAMSEEIGRRQLGIIATTENPFQLFRMLEASQTFAPAKGGETASGDIVVEKGPTGHKPGPLVGDLQAAGLPAAIDKGAIIIRKRHVAVREGGTITPVMATALAKLDINPIVVSMDLMCAFQGETFYPRATLDIDLAAFHDDLHTALSGAFNLAIYAGYPTSATITPLLARAHREALAVGVSAAIPAAETIAPLLARAYGAMLGVAGQAEEALDDDLRERLAGRAVASAPVAMEAQASAEPEADEEEEDEVSEEDAVSGLGALFG